MRHDELIYSEVESESFVIYCQGWKCEKEVLVWYVVSFPSHPSLPPFPFFIFFYLFFPPSPLCHSVLFCSGGFLPKCSWGAWGVLGFFVRSWLKKNHALHYSALSCTVICIISATYQFGVSQKRSGSEPFKTIVLS